jgi:hypothetical protein
MWVFKERLHKQQGKACKAVGRGRIIHFVCTRNECKLKALLNILNLRKRQNVLSQRTNVAVTVAQ